jgi:hypothetical protein
MLETDLYLQSAVLVAQTLEWEWQWWREQAYLQLHWPQQQEMSSDPWMTADCQSVSEKLCKFFILAFNACVKSVLLYGCETWLVTSEIRRKIQTFVNR